MTKKKVAETTVTEEAKPEVEAVPVDQEPNPEVPERQIEEMPTEQKVEPTTEAKVEPVVTPTIEPAKPESHVESILATTQPTSTVEAPALKPKPLTLESLKAEIEEIRQLISKLQETPVRQRKPPVSVARVQVLDKTTGKIYKSKNNLYKSLLAAGELKQLVDQGIFGKDPQHNNFGTFALLRAWPNRFEEIKAEVKDETTQNPQV